MNPRTQDDADVRRVLVLAPTPYFADRGCHVRIYEQALALQRRGVDLVVTTYPIGRTMADVPTVRTVRVPWYRKLDAGPSIHRVYVDGLLLAKALRVARRFRPDVIHAHLHEGAAIGIAMRAVTGLPVVFDIQGSLADELAAHGVIGRRSAAGRAVRAVERELYRRSDALVVNSNANVEMLRGFGIPPERVRVVPDSVDCVRFAPASGRELRARLGLGDGPVIGFLGVMTKYQGVDLLLDAFPRVLKARPDARLLMMGFPDEPYRRRTAAAGLDRSIVFTGRVPYEEVAGHLAAVDLAVSPKISATEGNGKLLNYMAMGLPTVAFDTPVNREILGDAGVLVRERTPEALADALIECLDAPEGRGIALRERAERLFSWDAAVEPALDAYRAALRHRRARRAA